MVLTTTQSTYSTRNTKIGAKIFTDFGQKNLKILTSILDHAEPPVYHSLLDYVSPLPFPGFPSPGPLPSPRRTAKNQKSSQISSDKLLNTAHGDTSLADFQCLLNQKQGTGCQEKTRFIRNNAAIHSSHSIRMLAAACTTTRHQQQVRAAAVVGGRHPRCTSSRGAHRAADGELIAHGRARYYTVRSSRTHHHRHHVPVRAIIIAAAGGTAARRRRRRASSSSSCVVVPVWAVGDRRGGGGGNDNDNDDAFVEMDRQTHGSIIFDRKTGRTEHADPKQPTTLRESVVMHTFYHPNIRGGEHAAWASRAVGAAAALVAFVAVAWWWKHTINVLWQKDKAGDDLEGNPAPTTTTSATTAGAIQVNDNNDDDTLKRDQEILRRRTAEVLGIVKPAGGLSLKAARAYPLLLLVACFANTLPPSLPVDYSLALLEQETYFWF